MILSLLFAAASAKNLKYTGLFEPEQLYALAQSSRNPSRSAAQTPCNVFFDQRAGKTQETTYDQLVEIPLENVEWRADETYNVHVNVHSRFLQSKGGVVPGDLFVGVSDGERVVGVLRATPTAAARSWAVPFTATAGERSLAPQSVVLAETAAAACGAQGCVRASSESFELFAHVGERVSLVEIGRASCRERV